MPHGMSPTISVIIPTYNRAALIVKAIESVRQQTYGTMEIIVCDDGSTDETEQVVCSRFPDVRYLKLEHSGLPSVARNEGIKVARGELIAFLDSDDRWMPEKTALQVEAMSGGAGMSCTNAWRVTPDGENLGPYLRDGQGVSGRVFDRLTADNFVIASTAIVRRDLLDSTEWFPEAMEFRGVEDYDLWLRISLRTDIAYLPQPLGYYLDQPGSVRSLSSRVAYYGSIVTILERAGMEARDQRLDYERTLTEGIWTTRTHLLQELLQGRQRRQAVLLFASLFRQRPHRAIKLARRSARPWLHFLTR